MQVVMGRQLFGINGKLIGVPMSADDAEVEGTIRAALASNLTVAEIVPAESPSAALLPPLTQPEQPKAPSMTAPAPGSFAASLKAILDEARAGLSQAKEDGAALVKSAVGELSDATASVKHVTGSMAQSIKDEADAVRAELGQISNNLTGEA